MWKDKTVVGGWQLKWAGGCGIAAAGPGVQGSCSRPGSHSPGEEL